MAINDDSYIGLFRWNNIINKIRIFHLILPGGEK